jgi:hypothetical protein
VAIDKDKVFELFGRYWEIAYNEGRTGKRSAEIANDVLAELRDALDADDGDVFTGQLVEIDGHVYGLRPGAARVVREALKDAGRYRWLRPRYYAADFCQGEQEDSPALVFLMPHDMRFSCDCDWTIDAAMAKDGA